MKPANTKKTFSNMEAGTARANWRWALPAAIDSETHNEDIKHKKDL